MPAPLKSLHSSLNGCHISDPQFDSDEHVLHPGAQEKWEGNILYRQIRAEFPLRPYEAAKLPGKINEFLSKSAKHVDNSPILLQSKFGKRRTIWKLVRSCQPDAFGISDGEGGRRGWKMPPNKKAMVSNAFLRLVAVNLNLPWPFVWPEWAIREEFRQGVCADETEFSYILCKNVFCGQVRAVYLHSQMDNGPVIHSNWNQNPVILTLVTEVTLRITF